MPYECDTCNKLFKQKAHYESHKARKNPCKKDASIEALVARRVQEVLATPLATPLAEPLAKPEPIKRVIKKKIRIPSVLPPPVVTNITKPFLKWVGGKTQIIDSVLEFFPRTMENYHEPFLGGGSVLLALLSQVRDKKITVKSIYASDLNPNLIGLYKNIQKNADAFIAEVKVLSDTYDSISSEKEVNRKPTSLEEAKTSQESYYYWIRSKFNQMTTDIEKTSLVGSAMFLFMNKTCFRGVYRVGPNGFNVPFGHYKNPGILDELHIKSVAALVKDVVFTCQPFSQALLNVHAGDFVYLDPPYAPENDKSFVGYNLGGFKLTEHQALFKACAELSSRGAKFLMSNAEVKLVKNAFPEPLYKTKIISCRRAINAKDPAAKTNEVLIRN